MGKHDKYRSSSRDRSPGRDSRYRTNSEDEEEYHRSERKYKEKKKYGDEEDSADERKRREKEEKKERKRREKEGYGGDERRDEYKSSGYGESTDRPVSRDRSRGFPGEQGGYGMYQESHGYGERPNVQVYGHPSYGDQSGYGSQPQTYQSPPPPSSYSQGAYGSGQGVYAYQPTSPPPVQYHPPGYQQHAYGGGGGTGAYSGAYQTTPPPPASYGAYQGYPPSGAPGPPPPQEYGYHPQEQPSYDYRPQEQPAAYGGYPPPVQQGPYAQGYQPPPGPPHGTPGYHSPPPPLGPAHGVPGYHPPQPTYGTSGYHSPQPTHSTSGYHSPQPTHGTSGYHSPQTGPTHGTPAYGAPAAYGAATGPTAGYNPGPSHPYKPQHHSAQQQQESHAPGQYGSAYTTDPLGSTSIGPVGATLDPANPVSKPGAAASALNTFTTGLNSALHGYARTLFPVAQKPTAQLGASGDSGAPSQTTENRFDSFAPVRGGNGVKWYVDGKDYMYAVSIALERAQESIWILDWWLSPELYLRRPPALNQEYRLDRMLQRAAARGVKVNIIVYKEVTQALTLNSSHTKHWLEDLHPNIGVFRHPDHLPDRPTIQQDLFNKFTTGKYSIGDGLKGLYGMSDGVVLYWAHHEKLCLVDGEIAFMGGLDLCFGRWDMNHHPIADAHPGDLNAIVFPGQDYNNARLMDFHTVEQWDQNKVSRTENSRMGWSDVALSLMGPTVRDLQRHFINRWNFIYLEKYQVRKDSRFALIDEDMIREPGAHRRKMKERVHGVGRAFKEGADYQGYHHEQTEKAYGHDASGRYDDLAGVQCQIVRSASKWSHGLSATEHSIAHAYIEIILAAKHFVYIENQFFITATDNKQSPIINKIGRAIVDRILRAASNREKFRIVVIMPAIPAFAGDLQDEASLGTRAIMEFQYRSICNDRGFSIMEQIAKAGVDPKQYIRFYNLRSYDRINLSRTVGQVQQASGVGYDAAAAALDAKVGGGYGQGTYGYGNPQPDAYNRYQQSAPGGSGEWDSVAKCTMLGGGDIRSVPWEGDPNKEMNAFVSEELYIHSKLLIADDRIVICGSANLNDRSQLGDHDSEIAVIIDDPTPLPSYMDGRPYQASHFAATLRRQIFRKHLGLIPAQTLGPVDENMEPVPTPNIYDFDSAEDNLVADPLGDNFWNFWNATAKTNTDAFGKAFHPVPHDSVTNWNLYNEWYTKYFVPSKEEKLRVEKANKERPSVPGEKKVEEKPKPMVEWGHVVPSEFSDGPQGVRELKDLLSRIKGNLVEMPLDFLKEEDIAKEGLGLNALTETLYT